jgi:alpha-D-ribose 1-methylphosphonate 5-triphosphate synthase subunit PhnH
MIEARQMQSSAQAAQIFRAILDAFAKPGNPVSLPAVSDCPQGLHAAAMGIALALCDYQTSIWFSPSIDCPELRNFLRFHTGAAVVTNAAEAGFAFVESGEFGRYFSQFNKGTDEYPDRSATVIVQAAAFDAPLRVKLEGPGTKRSPTLAVEGFGHSEWKLLMEDRILFPLGVDVAFVVGEKLVTVPRSSRISCLEKR